MASELRKILVIKFLSGLQFFGAVLVPFFVERALLTMAQILILQSVFHVSTLLFEVPTGGIADIIGRKWSIFSGLLAISAGALIYYLSSSFSLFVVAESIWGLGRSLLSGSVEAFVYDWLVEMKRESEAKKWYGKLGMAGKAGFFASAIPGSLMAHFIGITVPMLAYAIVSLVASILTLTLSESREFAKRKIKNYGVILRNAAKKYKTSKTLIITALDVAAHGYESRDSRWRFWLHTDPVFHCRILRAIQIRLF